jgi:hypothetical protein
MYFRRTIRNLGYTMEKETIALATKLLVKAQATNFDAEAAALAARAYRLLAAELNAYDDKAAAAGVARKRERRQLHDRRSTSASSVPSTPGCTTNAIAAGGRRTDWVDQAHRGQVDLMI